MIRKQGKKFCAFERKGIATLAKFQDEPNFFPKKKNGVFLRRDARILKENAARNFGETP